MLSLALPGAAHAATTCQTVHAKGVGQAVSATETVATIRGGGLVEGSTTVGRFTPGTPSGSVVPFGGTVEFDARTGTLLLTVTDFLDVATGAFSATSTGMSGTGGFTGATGGLTLVGLQNLQTGSFTEDVDGRLCVQRGGQP